MNMDSNRSFDGGCFLFTCGCLSGGCLGVVVVGAVAIGFLTYGIQAGFISDPRSFAYIQVQGDSMTPTLHEGDWVLVERNDLKASQVRRGDLVWINRPESERPRAGILLRVAGLPGETVAFGGEGGLLINGEGREEEYFDEKNYTKGEESLESIQLGEGELYLLGDEPTLAKDSRHWGAFQVNSLKGRASSIIFPPNRLQSLRD